MAYEYSYVCVYCDEQTETGSEPDNLDWHVKVDWPGDQDVLFCSACGGETFVVVRMEFDEELG